MRCLVGVFMVVLVAGPARAEDIAVGSLAELRAAALRARPGDRILLASGVHDGPVYLEGVRGEEARPVTIAGADREHPPVIRGGTSAVQISRPAWVVIEDLVIEGASGNGLNIDDGGDLEHAAPGVTVRRVVVRDIGPEGNCDGIKLSGLAGFRVEGCRLERWGSGGSGIDLVGCRDGVIEGCRLVNDGPRGASGVQMKGGSRDLTVSGCRFENAGQRAINIGGSTGLAYFRPAPRGFEAAGITVERCTIIGGDAAVAFVGVDGAVVRFNTIYHPQRWAVRILQETREPGFVPCRGGVFSDNLVVFDVPGAAHPNIGDATEPESFTFARNFWYCETDAARSRPRLPVEEAGGVYGQDPKLRDPANGDLRPEGDVRAGADAAR